MEESYGRDLTALAQSGLLEPVVGRHSEIQQIVGLFRLDGKRNLMVIGEPGVGKTRLVEGLALFFARSDSDNLAALRIVEVEVNRLVAGTIYRGQFEERLNDLIRVAKKPDVILFVDEAHLLVGAGGTHEQPQDAANTLKPYLARGEITMIGATTTREYAQIHQKDPAFTRRFQQFHLSEPTSQMITQILENEARKLGLTLGMSVSSDALAAVIVASDALLPSRFQPDKSIDVLRRLVLAKLDEQHREDSVAMDIGKVQHILGRQLDALRREDRVTALQYVTEWAEMRGQQSRVLTDADVRRLCGHLNLRG